jgi:glycerol kinase
LRQEFPQNFCRRRQVEHDPEDLSSITLETCRTAMRQASVTATDIIAIGIANQCETTLLWHRHTGRPVHHTIVW